MNLKKVLILTLCLISAFSLYAQDADKETYQAKVDAATQLLTEFDAASAQALLDEVLAQDSTFAPALFAYHQIELMYGNLSEAQVLVREAIDFNPSEQSYRDKFNELRDMVTQVMDAQREVDAQNYETAKRIYNELIVANPSVAELYYRLGFIAIQENDYDAARDNFDKASILAPTVEKYSKAKNILAGKILKEAQDALRMNDIITAERKTRTSLRINSEFGSAYGLLGYINLKQGDYYAAAENMEKAAKYNPTSNSAWYNLGSTYRRLKQYEKAEEALLKAIELKPSYAKSYTTIGQVYLALNQLDKAENNLKKAILYSPKSAAARESYGELLNNQERYTEAIVQLAEAAKLISNPSKKYFTNYRLAFAYNRSGDYRKALDTAREVTTARSDFGGGWFELGVAYAKLGDKQNALNAFNIGRSDDNWRGIINQERERLIQGKDISF